MTPRSMAQIRDELWAKRAKLKYDQLPLDEIARGEFDAGFDSALKFLSEQAGEFDSQAFEQAFKAKYDMRPCALADSAARVMFEQDRARIGLAEIRCKEFEARLASCNQARTELTARLEKAEQYDLTAAVFAKDTELREKLEKAERERDDLIQQQDERNIFHVKGLRTQTKHALDALSEVSALKEKLAAEQELLKMIESNRNQLRVDKAALEQRMRELEAELKQCHICHSHKEF